MPDTDVLVVSTHSTAGWQAAVRELVAAFERAGASVALAAPEEVARVRTFMLTDFVEARAARRAAREALVEHSPRMIVYCSMTAALLWPRPGAIWLDSIAAENRPGRHGVWQRIVERRRLKQAPLVLAMSAQSVDLLDGRVRNVSVVPTPVERSGEPAPERDIDALTYASGDPKKRRLELVLESWETARRPGERLVVAGIEDLDTPAGVELAGKLSPQAYRALLRRTRVFVVAPRREDYGIAPLEALADGCLLVSTPASGPYPALELGRMLDPRLISEQLGRALRVALDDPLPDYARRATPLLEPFSRSAVDRTISREVLPRLGSTTHRRP
ncbi:MAG: glycosyltransferase [Solirubrobacterales bacterium]|nr:glycosyltransferase [Solirubrobacterales bacterium]